MQADELITYVSCVAHIRANNDRSVEFNYPDRNRVPRASPGRSKVCIPDTLNQSSVGWSSTRGDYLQAQIIMSITLVLAMLRSFVEIAR
jgi:hypothetical protein